MLTLLMTLACGDKDPTTDSVEADTDTDADADTDTDADADSDSDTDSDTDTDVEGCSPANVVDDVAASFTKAAGTWTLSQLSAGDATNSPWTHGTAYDVTVDPSGTITYQTDADDVTCCWDGSTFDVIYGDPNAYSDLNIVTSEGDGSTCAVNWSGASEDVTRVTVMTSAYEVFVLY